MFLKKRKVKGKIYWSIVESFREKGKVKQNVIVNLGNTERAYEYLKVSGEYDTFLSQIEEYKKYGLIHEKKPIYTVYQGCNSGLIKDVVKLYFEKGSKIADVTYGKGVFWRDIDQNKYHITGTDIKMGIDFRNLPYEDKSFDHSVIDPPYARIEGLKGMQDCYNTTRFTTHEEILGLYKDGLKELRRITRDSGYILCKCQDEIYGCKHKWTHIEIKDIAEKELGLYAKDLFILVNTKKPKPIYKQQHARKIHSYLWVFQKI